MGDGGWMKDGQAGDRWWGDWKLRGKLKWAERKEARRTFVVVKVHFADIFAGAGAGFHDGRVVVSLRPGVRVVMW